ncbi:dioxygenase family protein [Streptomyces sp. NBC_00582]|uniref:dioxygenase family protein n=1 Tax=Streptomyces sp. NBC_00582 TaxID=2975783 RepID=UPI002E80FEE2|nr:catechol 1,2-dioxygenase [Streptomyces sp. NBC_00582]WUB67025.1 catechol 1,2-dioxygenase [Streptomyces sp. NBC_00582]
MFDDLQKTFGDVALRQGITFEELGQAITYVQKLVASGEFPLATTMLLINRTMEVSHGRAYAHPEKDGASTWMATGPAYVPGAPEIDNPGVLPMAPDEPGDTLFVSGVVRSTSGKPPPGAVIDLWQTTADGRYAGLTPEQAGLLEGLDVVDFDLPKYHLRGNIVAYAEGRYEYRTVLPGVESAAVPGSLLDDLLHMLGRDNSRARHIHAHVTREDHHMLTHQIHFDGDPLVDTVSEGAIARELIHETELHENVAAWEARGLTGPHRTLWKR